jgi:hypothetical protein
MYLVSSMSVISTESSPANSSQEPTFRNRVNLSDTHIWSVPLSGINEVISACIVGEVSEMGGGETIVHVKGIWKLLHLANFLSASSDERAFISILAMFGVAEAISMADQFNWKCSRVVEALHSVVLELLHDETTKAV